MKKLMLITMVCSAFLFTNQTEAQFRVNVNLNRGRPGWGLPATYPGDYYYLPEIDTYYDIPQRQFIYLDRGNWMYASELPYMYRDYDLYNGYKVVIDEPRPYMHCDVYRQRYSSHYNTYRPSVVIAPRAGYPVFYDNNRIDHNRHDSRRYDNRYDNRRESDRNNNNDKFNLGRENQHFNNKRNDYDRNQRFENISRNNERGNNVRGNVIGNGRWKSERDRD